MEEEKTEKIRREYTLVLETAVEAGSLALFKGGNFIDGSVGEGVKSRSEDVLPQIKQMLERNQAEKCGIGSIVVSNGPGSFTGARIGAGLARGLSRAFGCPLRGISVLEALASNIFFNEASNSNEQDESLLTAIPFAKTAVCWQQFRLSRARQVIALQKPQAESLSDFAGRLNVLGCGRAILHETLYFQISNVGRQSNFFANLKFVNAGKNLAALIGRRCFFDQNRKSIAASEISPIYVRSI